MPQAALTVVYGLDSSGEPVISYEWVSFNEDDERVPRPLRTFMAGFMSEGALEDELAGAFDVETGIPIDL